MHSFMLSSNISITIKVSEFSICLPLPSRPAGSAHTVRRSLKECAAASDAVLGLDPNEVRARVAVLAPSFTAVHIIPVHAHIFLPELAVLHRVPACQQDTLQLDDKGFLLKFLPLGLSFLLPGISYVTTRAPDIQAQEPVFHSYPGAPQFCSNLSPRLKR